MLLLPQVGFPEGSKQIAPFFAAEGKLCLDKSRNEFGFFDAIPEFRINIYIADLTEKFYFGLGKVIQNDSLVEVKYQLRDPAGNIIIGPTTVPVSGAGFISTYDQDTIGPFPAAGGYDPIQRIPSMPGNYSLEFYYPPDQGTIYTYSSFVTFKFFDITVVNAGNHPIPGRVWSKAWQFNCGPVEAPPTTSRFYGTMFILSDDSIVTSVNCNGFVGGTFSISSNKTGCSTTGNLIIDRQSRPGFHTYPQYKVFLNDPDSIIFPTGKAQPGISPPITTTTNCASGTVDIGVKVDMDGVIDVMVEVDPNPGADPRDVKLTSNVFANPGGNGYNIIHWNGLDGQGNRVPNGTSVTAVIRFIHGITHLPIYDIEYNDYGYKVEVIRPPGPKPDIYWDDSLLPDSTSNLTGCKDIFGCHLWEYITGDTNTVNSWWYVASSSAPAVSFTYKRSPGSTGKIAGDPSFCEGGITRTYTIKHEPNSTSYTWSYSGTGATIVGNDTFAIVSYSSSATSGTLSVSGYNKDCGNGPISSLPINFYPLPQVNIAAFDSICANEPAFQLTGGSPAGGTYLVNGIVASSFDPAAQSPGIQMITYKYTDGHGCKNADSSTVFVKTGSECEIALWTPNAFTPNGDGLNDTFQPVSMNIRSFSMEIYSRYGELIYTTDRPAAGWDGTFKGSACPEGSYVYIIVYQSSLAPPENTTLKGSVILVR